MMKSRPTVPEVVDKLERSGVHFEAEQGWLVKSRQPLAFQEANRDRALWVVTPEGTQKVRSDEDLYGVAALLDLIAPEQCENETVVRALKNFRRHGWEISVRPRDGEERSCGTVPAYEMATDPARKTWSSSGDHIVLRSPDGEEFHTYEPHQLEGVDFFYASGDEKVLAKPEAGRRIKAMLADGFEVGTFQFDGPWKAYAQVARVSNWISVGWNGQTLVKNPGVGSAHDLEECHQEALQARQALQLGLDDLLERLAPNAWEQGELFEAVARPAGPLSLQDRLEVFDGLAQSWAPEQSVRSLVELYSKLVESADDQEVGPLLDTAVRLFAATPGSQKEGVGLLLRARQMSSTPDGRRHRGDLVVTLLAGGASVKQAEAALPLLTVALPKTHQASVATTLLRAGGPEHDGLARDLEAFLRFGPDDLERRLGLYSTLLRCQQMDGHPEEAAFLYIGLGETTPPDRFEETLRERFDLFSSQAEAGFFEQDLELVTVGDHSVNVQD